MMFTIGSGRTLPPPRCCQRGIPLEVAAARATAIETASTAFAPSADLSAVPSRAIEEGVDLRLIERVSTDERGSDRLADMPHRAEDTVACEAIRVAVAELPGLVASCRGARRHTRAREAAVAQLEIDLDGRATAASRGSPARRCP